MEPIPLKTTIYIFRCLLNNKIYVGSTNNYWQRGGNHWHALRRGKHTNIPLQLDYNKYGRDNFESKVVEECLRKLRQEREWYWVCNYNSLDLNFGYNILPPLKTLGFGKQRLSVDDVSAICECNWLSTNEIAKEVGCEEEFIKLIKKRNKKLPRQKIKKKEFIKIKKVVKLKKSPKTSIIKPKIKVTKVRGKKNKNFGSGNIVNQQLMIIFECGPIRLFKLGPGAYVEPCEEPIIEGIIEALDRSEEISP